MAKRLITALAATFVAAAAQADINVGVIVSATGPAASLGIPERNTVALFPKTVGAEKINYIVLDDATDPTNATAHARKLITEHKVDVIVGPSTTPNSLAITDVAAESRTPVVSMASSARIVEQNDPKRRWMFKTPQNDIMMSLALTKHMADNGVKTVGFIGYSDAYGESYYQEFQKAVGVRKLNLVAAERYASKDTSVMGQVLKLMAAKPDAILIAGSGTPAALPQRTLKERGYTGRIYQTHGVANNDFLRVGAGDVEGTVLPVGPLLIASQLPADHPVRASAQTYVQAYEKANGAGSVSSFGGYAWDASQLLQAALPVALKSSAKPGTPEFRAALRDALEGVKDVKGAHGVFNMTNTDHLGLDQRSVVMVKIEKGKWKYLP